MCIEYGNTKVLMTGDLEERNSGANKNLYGETWLVENYPKLFENGVTLYKAGHHGSNSSSSKKLISTIKPKYVIISAIANSKATNDQGYWRFPRQEVLDTLLAATNNVYITGAQDASGQNANYHGDVTFTMDDNENVEVTCVRKDNSIDGKYIDKETHNACEIYDNNGELLKLYETEWFKQNRKYGLEVHVFSGFESQNNAYVGSCTLIKLGTLDILIDCGAVYDFGYSAYATSHFVEKVKSWCMDGVIEYVVVTSPTEKSLLYFADSAHGDKVVRKGIFSTFEVKNVIDCGDSYNPSQGDERSHFKAYTEARSEAVAKGANYKTALQLVQNGTNRMQVGEEFYLTILNNSHYGHNGKDRFLSFVSTMIEYKGKKLIFMPPGTTEELENEIVDKNKNNIAGTVFLLASDFGLSANSENLFNDIGKQQLTTVFTGIPGATISGITCLNDSMRSKFVNGSGKTYFGVELTNGGKYNEVCGDLFFRVYIGANNVVNTEMNASKECIDLSQWYDGNK